MIYNEAEHRARQIKVWRLMPVVQRLAKDLGEVPSALARRMDAEQRAAVAVVAQVRVASDLTWEKVISALELVEKKPMSDEDLFAGLGG